MGACQSPKVFESCNKESCLARNPISRDPRHEITGPESIAYPGAPEDHILSHRRPRAKGKETRELLLGAMRTDRACALLEHQELETICEAMECFRFVKGEPVLQQGDQGEWFFVCRLGRLEIQVNGQAMNELQSGSAFGGQALLYKCPRTASVICLEDTEVWGAYAQVFRSVLKESSQKAQGSLSEFTDKIALFDGLTPEQKDLLGAQLVTETIAKNQRVVTEGEAMTTIYFVKSGTLRVVKGASISKSGSLEGGEKGDRLSSGDCFGERAVLHNEPFEGTVLAETRCELVCIGLRQMREALGEDFVSALEKNYIFAHLRTSPVFSQFPREQQRQMVREVEIRVLEPGDEIDEALVFVLVLDGELHATGGAGGLERKFVRGDTYEGASTTARQKADSGTLSNRLSRFGRAPSMALNALDSSVFTSLLAPHGAKVACLSDDALEGILEDIHYTRKMLLTKKVPILRHLSPLQTQHLVKSLELMCLDKDEIVFRQGQTGDSFFVISNGEVVVLINGKVVRTMAKSGYFGERALLFEEARSATVQVSSTNAEFWCIDKGAFQRIVKGKMRDELVHRIKLQDTSVTMADLRHLRLIGKGAAGVVRLVEHVKTQTQYALKKVKKADGQMPEELKRECELMRESDHPFVVCLVKVFETSGSVYLLQEVLPGGELFDALRTLPDMLSTSQAQFYTGSLVLVLEALHERHIVYRDLKPENVMLDSQGYLKLIDFGIAKKIECGSKTYTMVGTPHYMAPELIKGRGYGTGVDIWSLGVMFFEFSCGYLPFADDFEDSAEVCTAIVKEPLRIPEAYQNKEGRALLEGLLTRATHRRLGAGISGSEEIREAEYFEIGYPKSDEGLFSQIMSRDLEPPVVPASANYTEAEDCALSDEELFAR